MVDRAKGVTLQALSSALVAHDMPASKQALALMQELKRQFDPRGDHLRFYTRRALSGLLSDFGFQEVQVTPAGGALGAHRVLLARGVRSRF